MAAAVVGGCARFMRRDRERETETVVKTELSFFLIQTTSHHRATSTRAQNVSQRKTLTLHHRLHHRFQNSKAPSKERALAADEQPVMAASAAPGAYATTLFPPKLDAPQSSTEADETEKSNQNAKNEDTGAGATTQEAEVLARERREARLAAHEDGRPDHLA